MLVLNTSHSQTHKGTQATMFWPVQSNVLGHMSCAKPMSLTIMAWLKDDQAESSVGRHAEAACSPGFQSLL